MTNHGMAEDRNLNAVSILYLPVNSRVIREVLQERPNKNQLTLHKIGEQGTGADGISPSVGSNSSFQAPYAFAQNSVQPLLSYAFGDKI